VDIAGLADLYPFIDEAARAMVFVDGENLSMGMRLRSKQGRRRGLSPWAMLMFHIYRAWPCGRGG
jgi:hypothetical protein